MDHPLPYQLGTSQKTLMGVEAFEGRAQNLPFDGGGTEIVSFFRGGT